MKSNTDKGGYIQITIPPGVYELESLNIEIKRSIIDEGHYTESIYPLTIKRNLTTIGSIMELSAQGPVITFVPDES